MKLTAQELEQMKNVDIGAVSADALADVSGMAFDRTLPREERLARFVKRAVNPYYFSVGGVGVKIEFPRAAPPSRRRWRPFLSGKRAGCDCCCGLLPLRDKMSRGIDILVDCPGQSYNISVM